MHFHMIFILIFIHLFSIVQISAFADILLGNAPNVYLYACNNPSESTLAKRRGYGTYAPSHHYFSNIQFVDYFFYSTYSFTAFIYILRGNHIKFIYSFFSYFYSSLSLSSYNLKYHFHLFITFPPLNIFSIATVISHNVPPYGRAGLYKELSSMKDLLIDLRNTYYSSPSSSSSASSSSSSSASSSSSSFSSSPSSSAFIVSSSLPLSSLKNDKKDNSKHENLQLKNKDELLKNLIPIIPMIATAAEKSGDVIHY